MWVGSLVTYPACGTVQALTIAEYIVTGIRPLTTIDHPWDTIIIKGIAFICMVSLTVLNFFPIEKYAARLQIFITAAKFLVVGVIIGTGLYSLIILAQTENIRNMFEDCEFEPGKLALAFYGGLWSYSGWDILNYGTPEIYKPRRTMPLAIITGLLAVCTVYVLMNLSYFVVLSTDKMLNSTAVAADFAQHTLGDFSYAIPFMIAVLMIGTLNSNVFCASRFIHAAARRGHLPPFLSATNKETGSPRAALVAQLFCMLAVSFVDIDSLINYVTFVMWGQRIVTLCALLYIRYTKMQVQPDAIRVPIVLIVLFLVISCILVCVPFIEETIMTCIGAACVFSGLIVYFVLVRPTTSISFIKSINDFLSGITCRILNCELDVVKKNDEESEESESINSVTEKSQEDNKNTKKTRLGATLLDVIQSGVENLDSGVGLYAPDAEAYTLFADLFNPVIEEYHNGFKATDSQPAMNLGEKNVPDLTDLDLENKFIVSTRVRCGRSLGGYPFNPCLTEVNYKNMEERMKTIFNGLTDPELKGTYYPLTGMDEETKKKLIADHFLFKEGDRFLQAANANRFWPTGRGIFHNEKKTFLVWVNEEDHLRIISMQPGGNVGEVLGRLIKGLNLISAKAPFARHPRLGWLTFCPTNLGTTVRASVHIKLPKVSAKPEFKTICSEMKLQIRGIHGEHSESAEGVYDISNKQRLGLTEFDAVKQMYDGVKKLIELEKAEG